MEGCESRQFARSLQLHSMEVVYEDFALNKGYFGIGFRHHLHALR